MVEEYIVKIFKMDFETHNVKRFIVEKPEKYTFIPGQATDVSINTLRFKDEKRPFTFTSKPEDIVLEFIIKKYPKGITEKIHELKTGNEIIIGEPFGTIRYESPGIFIAGGTGITPFLGIFRSLEPEEIKKNKLFFSNKTHKDIICEKELNNIFGENVIFLLTDEKRKGYLNKKINKSFLKKEVTDFSKYFYLCGPTTFVESIKKNLIKLGINLDKIIVER
jgi:hypothetical protein